MIEHLQICDLNFEIRRSPRRTTLGLTLDRGGELVIHAPSGSAVEELGQWAHSKLLWVYRKLAIQEAMKPQVDVPEYVTGERFAYLGRSYRLMIVKDQDEALLFDGSSFILRQDARSAGREHFRQWYISRGTEWITERLTQLTPRTGTHPTHIEVRDLGYRWGSCGKNQSVYINWKSLQLSPRHLDYLLIHELIHLTTPNHGSAFWRALERALPDWKQRTEELQAKARELFWCGVMEGEDSA